jgi:hypothetical protein
MDNNGGKRSLPEQSLWRLDFVFEDAPYRCAEQGVNHHPTKHGSAAVPSSLRDGDAMREHFPTGWNRCV